MIPHQKIRNRKIFSYHTPKCRFFRIEGWYLRRPFSQHPDQPEKNGLHRRQRQCLLYLSIKSHPSMSSVEEMRPAVGNLAILDDICQQVPVIKTYQRYSENSPEDWRNT